MSDRSVLAAEGDATLLGQVSALLEALPGTRTVKEPTLGLYGMVHRDRVGDQGFLLGELLVTTAEVVVNGEIGFSCVLGDEPDRARAGALLDAGLRSDHRARAALETLVQALEIDLAVRREEARVLVAATTVAFDVRPN